MWKCTIPNTSDDGFNDVILTLHKPTAIDWKLLQQTLKADKLFFQTADIDE